MNDSGQREGVLFVVSAPSGAGKTSLCREIIDRIPNLSQSISFATRAKRIGESEGVDYHFVEAETFRTMIGEGAFAEWAEVHGNLYGTALATLTEAAAAGQDLLLDIDCQGAAQLKDSCAHGVFIFILPPDYATLDQRLRGRGTDSEEVIQQRLANARQEIKEAVWYDYLIVNDDFYAAVSKLQAIITAERCRTRRSKTALQKFDEGE